MKKLGNQQPTTAIYLPYDETIYQRAVDWYHKTQRTCREWQANLLKSIYGINKDGLWAHTKFGYSVPRRNGKNEVVAIREFDGLMAGERILHTAHRTTAAHMAWERLGTLLDQAGVEYKSLKGIGRERIDIPETGGVIEFRTRSAKGGLGEGFDLLVIDEAQEYTDDEESALKYVVSDSDNPQTIFCGTPPTPLSSGTVFTNLRKSVLEGTAENSGWAEWSVEKQSDIRDKKLWYQTNPSLGQGLTERSITDEIGTDEVDFNIQRLGLWIKYNQKSAISAAEWDELSVSRLPKLKGKLFVGIKYGHNGNNVAMSIAAKMTNDKIFVEAIDCQTIRNGNDWIIRFLQKADIGQVVIDGANGQSILVADIKANKIQTKLTLPTVKEFIVANATFEQGIYQDMIRHKDQPSLTNIITNSDKRHIGTAGGFGYRSQFDDYDVALMDSAILAYWACSEHKPARRQRVSY